MITAQAFAGKHYAVLGLARSGLATVEALLASGARVTAWDDDGGARAHFLPSPSGEGSGVGDVPTSVAPPDSPHPSIPSPEGEGRLKITDFTTGDLTRFDSIVVTPGLPLNRHPIAERAREANVEIIGDIELFARARPELPPHKVVGITGTNGKSTTTALVHHILKTAGVPSLMGGNIGLPILSQDPLPEGGVYVLELSSYQIDLTKSLDCDVAVLLNITPDHLDRYASFEAYAQSKLRLIAMQAAGRPIVIGDPTGPEEDLIGDFLDELHATGKAPDEHYALMNTSHDHGVSFVNGVISMDGRGLAAQSDWPGLQGPHNAWNSSVAVAVCRLLAVDVGAIVEGLQSFPGLAHRMERLRESDGVIFINDSKATNAEASAPALAAFPRVRWIVGGQAKSASLGEMAAQLSHVVAAYTIGEAGPMFARLLRERGVRVFECETLENATKRAAGDSQPGETVLLSPASASFDQFRDFEARGDRFRELVEGL